MGRDDHASRIEWVAQTIGDGLGFDILSFDEADDSKRMLEVKATGLGKFFSFYVTANEVRCSDDIPDKFHLFRVFNMGREPRPTSSTVPSRSSASLSRFSLER